MVPIDMQGKPILNDITMNLHPIKQKWQLGVSGYLTLTVGTQEQIVDPVQTLDLMLSVSFWEHSRSAILKDEI